MSGGRRGGGGGGPRRPYYPNQRFRQYNDGGYNFSSDVNMDNSGSFVYAGANPPMEYYHHRPYGMGYGPPPPHGYHGGGYSPQYGRSRPRGYASPRPRGYAPFRGRAPRYSGYGHGGGQYHAKPHPKDFENLFYHPSMFEDPWRHLLPKSDTKDRGIEEDTKDNLENPAIKDVTVDDGKTGPDGGGSGADGDRTGCAEKVEKEKELEDAGSSETNGGVGDSISASGEQELAVEENSDVVEKEKEVVAAEASGTGSGGENDAGMDDADTTPSITV